MPQTPSLEVIFADGDARAAFSQALSSDALTKLESSIPPTSTDNAVALGCDISQIRAILIHSTGAISIMTRSSVPADIDTLAVAASKPILWQQSNGIALSALFTADFVSLHVDNAGASAATLTIWILSDATV